MKDKYFFDTNVFIYALVESSNEKDIGKKQRALSWIENKEIEVIISSQVLNEVPNTLLKKSKFIPVQVIETLEWMIDSLDVISLTPEISLTALDLHYRYQLSFYDSLIVSGAISSECEYLLTEDLQQGQVITYKSHLVKVVNPFV